jgi:hypothetical protein
MTEQVKDAAVVANAAAKKVNRRGINNSRHAVNRLKFHEKDCASNGLFVAHLESASVEYSVNADAKAFTGLKVPRLVLTFASNHTNPNERRYITKTLFPVESNVDTIPDGKDAWQVDNVLNWGKHILDIFYFKGREMTAEEEDALTLTFEDFTEAEDGSIEYVALDPQEIVDGYRHVFDNVAAMLNGTFGLADGETAKPCYKDANGNFVSCWIKLLRAVRNRKGEWTNVDKGGELSFSSFIGSGAIELVKGQNPPAILRVDAAKESITPKQVNKTPSVGVPPMPGMNAGMAVVGTENNAFNAPANAAFAGADGDMPF